MELHEQKYLVICGNHQLQGEPATFRTIFSDQRH